VDSSEVALARERCAVHPDRGAVGLCEGCGRTVCLECAVPFRGAIRCERCAALELGDPEPAPSERRRWLRAEHLQIAFLLIALGATIPAWHRSGTLTTRLSAWTFGLDGWAALSCVFLVSAFVVALAAALRRSAAVRFVALASILSAMSATAIAIALVRAPGFFSATGAPFLALGGTAAAATLGAFRLLRRPRP
jgi:hypothetical protein